MRNAGGCLTIENRDGTIEHWDTFTCCHCNGFVKVPPKCPPENMGGHCLMCHKPTCKRCADRQDQIGKCEPFEKWLDMKESRAAFRRSLG